MLIGVIADTHGVLPPAVHVAFTGVDHILHAGDVEGAWILEELALVAPVTAVTGNADREPLPGCSRTPVVLTFDGVRVLLGHEPELVLDSGRACGADVVVHGHTHVPTNRRQRGMLVFNPGSASQPRRSRRATVGLLEITDGSVSARLVEL